MLFNKTTTEKFYQQQNTTRRDLEGSTSGQREIYPERGAEVVVGMVSQEIGKLVSISKQTDCTNINKNAQFMWLAKSK